MWARNLLKLSLADPSPPRVGPIPANHFDAEDGSTSHLFRRPMWLGGVRCAGRALEGRYCEDLGLGRGTTKEKKKLFYLIGLKLYKLLDIYSLFTTAMTLFIILYVHAKLQRTAGLKKNSFIYTSSLLSGRGNAARLCPV